MNFIDYIYSDYKYLAWKKHPNIPEGSDDTFD